jgi:RNA polymerase sigma factor (sigma-70 family)
MDSTSLSLLERACSKDDSQSWNRLTQMYAPLLKHWLNRFEVQHADAEDIIQEVLTVVSAKLPEFRHNQRHGAFRSWLRKILIIRLKEFWRLRKKRPIVTGKSSFLDRLEELEDGHSNISQIWNREHDDYVMKRLIDAVKPRFEPMTWEAFWKQVMKGMPANVVSAEMGMPLSSVYVAKSRVLRVLKQESRGLIN